MVIKTTLVIVVWGDSWSVQCNEKLNLSFIKEKTMQWSVVITIYILKLTNISDKHCNSAVFFQASTEGVSPNFGLLFDIDGVLVRGREVLPTAQEAFKKLVDRHGRFRVPTVFVTNAGNALRSTKAEQLTKWLGTEVTNLLHQVLC